ncbi:MAG: hypothetical protein AB4352_27610 [Hormoscilla sp.]
MLQNFYEELLQLLDLIARVCIAAGNSRIRRSVTMQDINSRAELDS